MVKFCVGDRVEHALMGWEGIVILDLTSNFWCAEDYAVRFKINNNLEVKKVYSVEIRKVNE